MYEPTRRTGFLVGTALAECVEDLVGADPVGSSLCGVRRGFPGRGDVQSQLQEALRTEALFGRIDGKACSAAWTKIMLGRVDINRLSERKLPSLSFPRMREPCASPRDGFLPSQE